MRKRRGRPSKVLGEQILHQDAGKIAGIFLRYPLRQPVDPQFDPYYQRILKGDLASIFDYCDSNRNRIDLDGSFYEFLGRLVPSLESLSAAKQVISEIARRGDYLIGPTDKFLYRYWYSHLKPLCEDARQFIREKYKAVAAVKRQQTEEYIRKHRSAHSKAQNATTPSPDTTELKAWAEWAALVKPEQLWNEYVDKFFLSNKQDEKARSQDIEEFKAWAEHAHFQRRDPDSSYDLMEKCSRHHLIPKRFFFDLSKRSRHFDGRGERDQRYQNLKWLWTPSAIARQYACAVVGISSGTVSHRNVRK